MIRKAAAIYRINPGSGSAVGSVEKDVDPVPDNRARIFFFLRGVLWELLSPGEWHREKKKYIYIKREMGG